MSMHMIVPLFLSVGKLNYHVWQSSNVAKSVIAIRQEKNIPFITI
jgi:hypothetical protein